MKNIDWSEAMLESIKNIDMEVIKYECNLVNFATDQLEKLFHISLSFHLLICKKDAYSLEEKLWPT